MLCKQNGRWVINEYKMKIFINDFAFFVIPTVHGGITMGVDMFVVVLWKESRAAFQRTFNSRSYYTTAI